MILTEVGLGDERSGSPEGSVRAVDSGGTLNNNNARNGNIGVPPALNLSGDLTVSAKDGEPNTFMINNLKSFTGVYVKVNNIWKKVKEIYI